MTLTMDEEDRKILVAGAKFLKQYRAYITLFYGEECPDIEPDCVCCQAWARFHAEANTFHSVQEMMDATRMPIGKEATK